MHPNFCSFAALGLTGLFLTIPAQGGIITDYQSPNGPYLISQGPVLEGTGLAFPDQPIIVGPLTGNPFPLEAVSSTELFATDGDGNRVRGRDFIGATLRAVSTSGAVVLMTIDDVLLGVADADPPNPNYFRYLISQAVGPDWVPLCGFEGPTPVLAVPILGTWDSGANFNPSVGLTFACLNAAVGKCYARFGYNEVFVPNNWVDYLPACARMIRADYCGTGMEHTTPGTRISLGDSWVMHPWTDPPPMATFVFEAAWGPGGATCVNYQRHSELVILENHYPGRCPVVPPACRQAPPFGPSFTPPLLKNKCRQGPDAAGFCVNSVVQ